MRHSTVSRFRGRLTPFGTLEALPAGCSFTELLECQVLLRGYIADRKPLRGELGLDSVGQITDAELLTHAFRKWGQDLQAHVNGEYAVVIFDLSAHAALITHDALGLIPLFYYHRKDGLAFATHLADLVDIGASDTFDDEYLADFLVFGSVSSERTPYSSIKRLLPGQSLWWSGGNLRYVQSWNLPDVPPLHCRDDAEYEEQFRTLLRAGIQSALAPAGPTCIALSGGLDSSSIACVAADLQPYGLLAYSLISPAWPEIDEQRWMHAVVDRCNLPWEKVDRGTVLPFALLPRDFHGEPNQSVVDEKQLLVQEQFLASCGATVMLHGHGGDTVLCASGGAVPTHLADSLFDGKPIAALQAARFWKQESREQRSYFYWLVRTLLQPSLDHLWARQIRGTDRRSPVCPWIKRDYAIGMDLDRRARERLTTRCDHPGRQSLWNSLWMISFAMTPAQQRRTNVELRAPLLYRPLVEFMYRIPWEQKLQPRCDRYLQRRALKGVLPEIVRRRAGKASGNPTLVEGLRRSRDWVDFLCDSPLMAERGIVDADAWRQAVRQASVGQTHGDRYFLACVAVEAWLKQLREHRRQLMPAVALASG